VLCDNVECDSFQDGEAFLRDGGQMGPQPGILIGGNAYAINPKIFEVITVDTVGAGRADLTVDDLRELHIPAGSVGVVITRDGMDPADPDNPAPRVPGHNHFRFPGKFLQAGGIRGVQEETLSPGVYRINPWFARVQVIPTRDLILEWTGRRNKRPGRFDSALDELVVNVEGHPVTVGMTQVIRIPPQVAPKLVHRFGEEETDRLGASNAHDPVVVQRFVERVIGGTVEGVLRAEAAKYTYRNFVENYDEVRRTIEGRLASALAAFGVIPVLTTLAQFHLPEHEVDEQVRLTAVQLEENRRLKELLEEVKTQAEIDRIGIGADVERRKLDAVGLSEQIHLLGAYQVAMERITERLAQAPVPAVVVGSDISATLRQMPLYQARELLDYAFSGTRSVVHGSLPAPLEVTIGAPHDAGSANDRDSETAQHAQETVPVAVYLTQQTDFPAVRAAVEAYLRADGLEISEENEPVIGSLWWTAKARKRAANLTQDATLLADATVWGPVRSRQADNNLTNSQAARNLVDTLSICETGVIQIGSLLAVKCGGVVTVMTLSLTQVSMLERRPILLRDPDTVLEHLQHDTEPNGQPRPHRAVGGYVAPTLSEP
jgi:hypothetical protein